MISKYFIYLSRVGVFLLLISTLAGCTAARQTRVKLDPATQSLAENTGREAMNRGDCRAAIEAYTRIVAAEGDAYSGLGGAYLLCGNIPGAVAAYEEARRRHPEDITALTNLGTAQFRAGNMNAAETEFQSAVNRDPSNYAAVIGLSAIQIRNTQPEKALKTLKGLPPVDSDKPEALHNRAMALYHMGLVTEARQHLESAASKYPSDAETLNALGVIQLEQKQAETALHTFSKAIALQPENGVYHYNRGNAQRGIKRFPAAIADYNRAIAFEPEMVEAYINRGDIQFLLGNIEAACQDLEYACKRGQCDRLKKYRASGRCGEGL